MLITFNDITLEFLNSLSEQDMISFCKEAKKLSNDDKIKLLFVFSAKCNILASGLKNLNIIKIHTSNNSFKIDITEDAKHLLKYLNKEYGWKHSIGDEIFVNIGEFRINELRKFKLKKLC